MEGLVNSQKNASNELFAQQRKYKRNDEDK